MGRGKIEIVFDGPPSHEAGRFVEVEQDGKSINFGKWEERKDGFWHLVLPDVYAVHKQLVTALSLAFDHSCLRSESRCKWTITDQRVHEAIKAAIAKAKGEA